MSSVSQRQDSSNAQDQDLFLHLKEFVVPFDDGDGATSRPKSDLILKYKDKTGFKIISEPFKRADPIRWKTELLVKSFSEAVVTIRKRTPIWRSIAKFHLRFDPVEYVGTVDLKDEESGILIQLVFATSQSSVERTRHIGGLASSALASKVSVLKRMETLLDFMDVVMVIGGAVGEFHTVARAIVTIVSQALAKFREITTCHQQLVDIMNDLISMLPVMRLALERVQDDECLVLVQNFLTFTHETSKGLIEYATGSPTEFLIRNWFKSKTNEVIRLQERSTHLKLNTILGVGVNTQGTVSDIRRNQLKQEQGAILGRIKPPKLSSFDPRRCCMSGTRASIIHALTSFALDNNHQARLYWLYGIAGSGKSSIAASVAMALDSRDRLSGSFFCKRDIAELRNPINLIHTIAYSIAEAYVIYRNILIEVLDGDSRIEDKALALQFDALVREPLSKISQEPSMEPVILIVDALDECDDSRSISLYLGQLAELVPWLKLIITSRPLPEIERGLRRPRTITCDLFNRDAHQDIESFIRAQFSPDGPLNDLQPYVDNALLQELSQKSSGLFIWIVTVLSYVSRLLFGKHAALLDILSSDNASGPEEQLDTLYLQVLHAVTGSSPANQKAVKTILALIYVTSRNRPLLAGALHTFVSRAGIRVSLHELDNFLRQMGSVVTTDMQTGGIRVCHPSFLDFIGSQSRSKDFWMKTEDVDTIMAKSCFEIMETELKFNICGLESSFLRNDEVLDLQTRIARHVSGELQYSCIYWLDHLSKGDYASKQAMFGVVEGFLGQARCLYWLEVLSLISELNVGSNIVQELPFVYKENPELRAAALELYRFINVFHEPISISTPHIYISAIVWTPSSSPISKFHSSWFNEWPLIKDGRQKNWPANLHRIDCQDNITSVAYSPDESRVVTGFENGYIRILDALSGSPIGVPLVGHDDHVSSLSLSKDGTRIVSGSRDKTIRIWDALSGAPIGAPLIGHASVVCSVQFSPEGIRIVSGSWDSTIRIWDALTGTPIGTPLMGHTDRVTSVAYAPDGSRIISASDDRTIRTWDAMSGAPIGSPLVGHSQSICSVSYSPDMTRIVSGSWDYTIRVWDVMSGSPIGAPLKGHTNCVSSVTYSPDGSRIVSGSHDKKILVWDAFTGDSIGAPLVGHTSPVFFAAYSLSGTGIVSASWDNTIRFWDANAMDEPPEHHTTSACSVTWSPDAKSIVSGLDDGNIRIWNAHNGNPIGEPLKGHADRVSSVVYNLDGTRFFSGSWDNTIRIWDAQSGTPIDMPLRGAESLVCSVASTLSRMVSGYENGALCIWDAQSGERIGSPFIGHKGAVCSISCSPDGAYFASGSDDSTIRVWDARTGDPIGAPLTGHTDAVYSVQYSPDGSRIVSGSSDKTIRIWDALNGVPIGEPLTGHESIVCSVAYSPNGKHIASGSWDKTIRVWDALTGVPVGVPLVGHTDSLCSVQYSPDGTRIASCSDDGTIRIWDARPDVHMPVPSVSDDGWIRTEGRGLLLWVPPESRHGIYDMSLFSIPRNAVGHPIKLDWEGIRNAWY